jgi:hypothetical protein
MSLLQHGGFCCHCELTVRVVVMQGKPNGFISMEYKVKITTISTAFHIRGAELFVFDGEDVWNGRGLICWTGM